MFSFQIFYFLDANLPTLASYKLALSYNIIFTHQLQKITKNSEVLLQIACVVHKNLRKSQKYAKHEYYANLISYWI